VTPSFLALRCALGVIWIAAGLAKIGKPSEFSATVRAYGIVPARLVPAAGRTLPVLELLLGLALVAGVLPRAAGLLAASAFVVFAAAMAWNLAHGRRFDCGCGISRETTISWRLVGRNVTLAVAALAAAAGPSGGLALVRGSAPAASSPGDTTLIAIPMIVALLAVIARLVATVGFMPLGTPHDRRAAGRSSSSAAQVERKEMTTARSD
jgi:uncharacterized membrane protein YphA (DoxX/SURF4 family)